jgi:hypothetical protein
VGWASLPLRCGRGRRREAVLFGDASAGKNRTARVARVHGGQGRPPYYLADREPAARMVRFTDSPRTTQRRFCTLSFAARFLRTGSRTAPLVLSHEKNGRGVIHGVHPVRRGVGRGSPDGLRSLRDGRSVGSAPPNASKAIARRIRTAIDTRASADFPAGRVSVAEPGNRCGAECRIYSHRLTARRYAR